MKFCNQCGQPVSLRIPADDDRERYICDGCDHIHYLNPRVVVCSIPCHGDQVLLCKRAIEPRHGLWTLPGGFLENGETTQEGARRETVEEAGARIDIHGLYSLYNLPHIDQVHLFFLASLSDLNFRSGPESLETRLFRRDEVPWDQIAFAAVKDTLELYFRDLEQGSFPLHIADVLIDEAGRRAIRPQFEPVPEGAR